MKYLFIPVMYVLGAVYFILDWGIGLSIFWIVFIWELDYDVAYNVVFADEHYFYQKHNAYGDEILWRYHTIHDFVNDNKKYAK